MKKYEFVYPYDLETTMQLILEGTQEGGWFDAKWSEGIFVKVLREKNCMKLLHASPYFKNAFRPIFILRLREENHKTIATGYWRWHLFMYFWFALLLWILGFSLISEIVNGDYANFLPEGQMGVVFIVFAGIATWLERGRMRKILAHLKKHAIEEEI